MFNFLADQCPCVLLVESSFCNKNVSIYQLLCIFNSSIYCRWKKSCTTLDGWNPINNGISHLSTGAGFLPSTVSIYLSILSNQIKYYIFLSYPILSFYLSIDLSIYIILLFYLILSYPIYLSILLSIYLSILYIYYNCYYLYLYMQLHKDVCPVNSNVCGSFANFERIIKFTHVCDKCIINAH